MEVTLEPKTRHGKNRLAEIRFVDPYWHGRWQIVSVAERVSFAPGKRGPWYLLVPLCSEGPFNYMQRWVHASDDTNFNLRPNNNYIPD